MFLISPAVAQDVNDAARELARQLAAGAAPHEPASLTIRNLSSLGATEAAEVRRALETGLRSQDVRLGESPPMLEIRVAISESLSQFLLVAEVRRGEERRIVISGWTRPPAPSRSAPTMTLEKKLLWEQEQPVLDLAFVGDGPAKGLLILDPTKITLQGETSQSLPVPAARPWPRDMRGRLILDTGSFEAYLPGMLCRGAIQPTFTMECKESAEGWPLKSGGRFWGLAHFMAGRNFFGEGVVTAPGGPNALPPFFSVAATEAQGAPLWIFAGLDGHAHAYDKAGQPAGSFEQWGSDIAGLEAPCGSGRQILATRPGDPAEADAIHAWEMVNREPRAVSSPAEFPGPVTALWPAGPAAAVAVSRDPHTGRYAVFSLALACGS